MDTLPCFYKYSENSIRRLILIPLCLIGIGTIVLYLGYDSLPWFVTGGIIIVFGIIKLRPIARKSNYRDSIVEIHDYCVIDVRSFKEWVYWEDVKEIQIHAPYAIALKIDDEDRYAREPRNCLCDHMLKWMGLPRLTLTPMLLDCTFPELYRTIRRASGPYDIPIRRVE